MVIPIDEHIFQGLKLLTKRMGRGTPGDFLGNKRTEKMFTTRREKKHTVISRQKLGTNNKKITEPEIGDSTNTLLDFHKPNLEYIRKMAVSGG